MTAPKPSVSQATRHLWQRWSWIGWAAIACIAGYVLFSRLRSVDFHELWQRVTEISLCTLLVSLLCCGLSFVAIGLYEIAAVRVVAGRVTRRYAFVTGCVASAIGHCTGAAILAGGLIRLRRLSPLGWSSQQVGTLSVLAAMPFLLGVGWLLDVSLILGSEQAGRALHLPASTVSALGWIGLGKDVGWLIVVAVRRRPLAFGKGQLKLPTLRHTMLQVIIGIVETLLVSLILYLLLQPSLDIGLPAFVAVYVLAIVVSVISHVPAGLGVLEATLLLLLPQMPPAHLVGSVLAYRAVFELLPLALGLSTLALNEIKATIRLRVPRTVREGGRIGVVSRAIDKQDGI